MDAAARAAAAGAEPAQQADGDPVGSHQLYPDRRHGRGVLRLPQP